MGNNTGKPLSNQTAITDEKEIDSLVERINRLSNGLYKMYGLNFADNKFCNRVAITYEKKLGQLPLYKLTDIDKSLNKPAAPSESKTQMEAFLKYEPKPNEKFMVNDLKENIVDFFTDKNIDFGTIDQINTSVPNIKYINPKTLAALRQSGGADPNAAMNKLLSTLPTNSGNRPPRQPQQPFRRNKKFRRDDRPPRPPQQQPRNNRPPRNDRPPPPPRNNRPPRQNKHVEENMEANLGLTPEEMMLENNVKLSNMENKTKPKSYLNETQEVKKLLENKKDIKKEFVNIAKNEAAMTEVLNKREKNIKAVNLPKTEPLPSTPTATTTPQPAKGLSNINKRLTCGKDEKECYLTQAELCERISKYYVLKGNIIAVILSAIPRKKDGKMVGSFCYNRFQALKDGRLCLPPGINELENMSLENKLRRLSKFINNMDEFQCKGVSGYYRILNEKEKTALVTNDSKFNKYYILYTAKLYNQYLESLRQLMGILEVLESDYAINNAKLNEIALKVKSIVDSMHTLCQFNYISAILAYLRADLDVSQRDRKEKNKEIAELEKGLTL